MIFLNSASSAAALVFDLPLCTHTDNEGKPREAKERNILENLRKNTIFNEHPVCIVKNIFFVSGVSRCQGGVGWGRWGGLL